MEKSQKEEVIYSWKNHERLFGGRVFEIDAQERAGLTVIVSSKSIHEQNHQERKSTAHYPGCQGF